MPADSVAYVERRPADSRFLPVRGLRYHFLEWGSAALASPGRPTLVLLHGWMDVAASFQFVVDALAAEDDAPRHIVAPDWRGFGRSDRPAADGYWFPDYLADLETLLGALMPGGAIDLVGHSMGGNVAMIYAGLRPQRVRRLVNLEGFGLPDTEPGQAPQRLRRWLDELKTPPRLRSYADVGEVADRLLQTNPRLAPDKAAWLAAHWSAPGDDGRRHVLGDPAHKRLNPVLYRKDEVLASWRLIEAPVLWVEGAQTDVEKWWGHRYPRAEFEARLTVVRRLERLLLQECGHMVHHDQPQALARRLVRFLDGSAPAVVGTAEDAAR